MIVKHTGSEAADLGSGHFLQVSANEDDFEARIEALHAAREPARGPAWRAASDVLNGTAEPLPAAELLYERALADAERAYETRGLRGTSHRSGCALDAAAATRGRKIQGLVLLTATVAWRLAVVAAFHASWRVAYLLNDVPRSDPWRPLLDLWSRGAGPAGAAGDSFVVFLPESTDA
jgi:hypothetical protein